MNDNYVPRQQEKRALARLIVEMEINDMVAIEAVRIKRRLKANVELRRAVRRARRKEPTP